MDQKKRAEFSRIYERDGALDPAVLVQEAKKKTNPFHSSFTWDDSKAAHEHRLNEARHLIRVAVTVIPEISNRPVREYVSLSTSRKTSNGSYLATVDIVSDEQRRAQALEDAIKSLQQLERRFGYLTELEPVWDTLAKLTAEAEAQAA